jgi:hypothetical protein
MFVFERALSNQSIIWVNKSNWMGLTIHNTSESISKRPNITPAWVWRMMQSYWGKLWNEGLHWR